MTTAPLYIVDIIGEVVQAVDTALFPTLNKHILYTYGRSIQIQTKIQQLNNSIKQKDNWYPLVALFQDFPETLGGGYYAVVKIPKISIAMLTLFTDDPPTRYGKTFKPILYPIFDQFLVQLAKHPNVVGSDPGAFEMVKWDRPGTQPEGSNLNQYLDAIEIQNLTLTFWQKKNCKTN